MSILEDNINTVNDVDSVQEALIQEVCDYYGRKYSPDDNSKPSIRDVARRFGLSTLKVKKLLVTGGLFRTNLSDKVQKLYADGMTPKEIADQLNISACNVNSYLPYRKIVYNLGVKSPAAEKVYNWRKEKEQLGKPSEHILNVFNNVYKKFLEKYSCPLNIRIAAYNASNMTGVYVHFVRLYGFENRIPKNVPLEDFLLQSDGHCFMWGLDNGESVDGILLREDVTNLENTFLRIIAMIYCRRYEFNGDRFYNHLNFGNNALYTSIMTNGYALWSNYIVEKIAGEILPATTPNNIQVSQLESDILEVINTGDPSLLAWVFSNIDIDAVLSREGEIFPFRRTHALIAKHKNQEIKISYKFIKDIGKAFMIELHKAQDKLIRKTTSVPLHRFFE